MGGKDNYVPGDYSNAVGHNNKVEEDYAFASGQRNYVLANHASAFGLSNTIKGDYSFASGSSNSITGEYSYASGYDNYVDGDYSAGFGKFNDVTGDQAMAFGINNDATSTGSVAFGINNKSSGAGSVAFGNTSFVTNASSFGGGFGIENYGAISFAYGDGIEIDVNATNCNAIGEGITIEGSNNSAFGISLKNDGLKSMALGNLIRVSHEGSFVIGDNQDTPNLDECIVSENINQIVLRFTGDEEGGSNSSNVCFRFITETEVIGSTTAEKNGVFLHRGGNSWSGLSDRNLKKNIQDIDKYTILEDLRQVPIKSWQWRDIWTYKDNVRVWDDFSYTWLGPMAQDFHSVFGSFGNGDSTLLNSATMDAVMFASIQALAEILDNHSQTITSEKEKIDSIDNFTKELLTKSEFEKFKSDIDCLDSVCERVSTLEANYTDLKNNSSTFLTKSEFNSFKDSISCYEDACKRIKDLEDTIDDLKKRLNVLESADTSGSGGPIYNQSIIFNSNDLEHRVILEQNNPNPFDNETKINYYIPSEMKGNAELMLTDEKGSTIIKKLEACIGKPCSITLSSDNLETGVYIYALLINGKIIKSQKMMIIK